MGNLIEKDSKVRIKNYGGHKQVRRSFLFAFFSYVKIIFLFFYNSMYIGTIHVPKYIEESLL